MAYNLKEIVANKPSRFTEGHRMCAGCGAPVVARHILRALKEEDHAVIANATGCMEVSTFIYPYTAWTDSFIHTAFECAGSTFTANQAVQIVARGGKIMMVGTQSKPVPIDFLKINREVTIQTSFRYCNNFPQTIEAIASGKFNVKDMVTHVYDYKDVQQAFMDAIDPEKKVDMVKGVVKVAE